MLRRCLTLGVPLTLAAFLFTAAQVQSETRMVVFALVAIGIAIEMAATTTRSAARYGAGGMVAGMATMMAAMGTGLSIGYATGMIWDLGWANLVGVLAGGTHGLVMGRRYGPMAALDGAGGGVMGGLMGPMLGVMLLYLPASLILTAILMLALQAAFSVGGVYLVAAAAGAVAPSGWLHRVGHVLGSQHQEISCCLPRPASRQTAPGDRAAPSPSRRAPARNNPQPRRWLVTAVAALAGALAVLFVTRGLGSDLFGARGASSSARSAEAPAALAVHPVTATVGQDGVQQLAMSLRYPRYEPRLMEAKAGVPVRLTLEAIGDPG